MRKILETLMLHNTVYVKFKSLVNSVVSEVLEFCVATGLFCENKTFCLARIILFCVTHSLFVPKIAQGQFSEY